MTKLNGYPKGCPICFVRRRVQCPSPPAGSGTPHRKRLPRPIGCGSLFMQFYFFFLAPMMTSTTRSTTATTTMAIHSLMLLVSVGEHVRKGPQIASMGSTGISRGNHCDFRIQLNGTFLNPLNYL